MKIVIGRLTEDEVLCEASQASLWLPRRLFPVGVRVGDIGDYEDGAVTMWDEERQYEEEQLKMFFKMMC